MQKYIKDEKYLHQFKTKSNTQSRTSFLEDCQRERIAIQQ
ncbi:unnamed protein product [Paramecium primaurelia]|uniref:Uncharacterized protein n=1 Tax=Paramecium primaurelia TaxID=5886 RepID=A0A8S1K1P1_PARPR|nr:unnamed protein product [Paramecium primaurelia]